MMAFYIRAKQTKKRRNVKRSERNSGKSNEEIMLFHVGLVRLMSSRRRRYVPENRFTMVGALSLPMAM